MGADWVFNLCRAFSWVKEYRINEYSIFSTCFCWWRFRQHGSIWHFQTFASNFDWFSLGYTLCKCHWLFDYRNAYGRFSFFRRIKRTSKAFACYRILWGANYFLHLYFWKLRFYQRGSPTPFLQLFRFKLWTLSGICSVRTLFDKVVLVILSIF